MCVNVCMGVCFSFICQDIADCGRRDARGVMGLPRVCVQGRFVFEIAQDTNAMKTA